MVEVSELRQCHVPVEGHSEVVKLLLGNSEGTVTGFKMTDGSGVGVKVKLAGGPETWFFQDEIAPA